jgi:hypothetical protein
LSDARKGCVKDLFASSLNLHLLLPAHLPADTIIPAGEALLELELLARLIRALMWANV